MEAQLPATDIRFQFKEQLSQDPVLPRKLYSSTDKRHYNLWASFELMAREHFVMNDYFWLYCSFHGKLWIVTNAPDCSDMK